MYLKVSWNFEIEKLVTLVNRLAQRSLANIYFEYEDGALRIKPSESWVMFWRSQRDVEKEYVLPASIEQPAPTQLTIPMPYVVLVHAYYHFAFKANDRLTKPPDNISLLGCHLDYVDISGMKHHVDLVVDLEMAGITTDEFMGHIKQIEEKN